jgi:alpha-tubulin suppressor-like RCC1 family protein
MVPSCLKTPPPLTDVVELSSGTTGPQTCARKRNNDVFCWGANDRGQLGIGTFTDRFSTPQQVPGLTQIVSVSNSGSHTCALKADGAAYCWGGTEDRSIPRVGSLADGTIAGRFVPTAVFGLGPARQISLSGAHVCALKIDRTVACWGNNLDGQVDGVPPGFGETPFVLAPRAVPGLTNVAAVGAGGRYSCAMRLEGTVFCWGNIDGSANTIPVTQVPGVSGAVALSVGTYHACVLDGLGRAHCWGVDYSPPAAPLTPWLVPGFERLRTIAAGNLYTCAIRQDQTVTCWGYNSSGQLGDGTTGTRMTPLTIPGLSNVVGIAVSLIGGVNGVRDEAHTCAVKADGTVACWGGNRAGQLGRGTFEPYPFGLTPANVVGLSNATSVSVAGGRRLSYSPGTISSASTSCATKTDGTLWCWGNNSSATLGLGVARIGSLPFHVAGLSISLNVTKAGLGTGTVTSVPAGIACGSDCSETYSANAPVTLAAVPATGSVFAGWSGACSGILGCVLTMDASKNVTATFNTITSSLPVVTLSASDPTATEAGRTTGTFTVTRTGTITTPLTVRLSYGGTSTKGLDRNALPLSIVIPAGAASATITVTPIDDSIAEPAETVIATLSTGAGYTMGAAKIATVTIQDNDSVVPTTPVVSLVATDPTATEAGATTGTFTLTRTGTTTVPLSVALTYSGTSTKGLDRNLLPLTVVIPAGVPSATITVTPIDDNVVEPNETVIATISAGTAYTLGATTTAMIIIVSNE